jgi:enoyl-CoA hydratase
VRFENILYEKGGGLAVLAFNRPAKMNPLDWSTVRDMRRAVADIEADDAVRTVIVTGTGPAFSAGGDLDGYIALYQDAARFRAFLDDFYALCAAIEASTCIFIAAVNGVCVAGGLEVLLACDVAIAAEGAMIGDGHIKFAQLPGAGGSQRLPRAVGVMRAKHLMLTGRMMTGTEAERIGLVTEAVPDGRLMAHARELAGALAARSPTAIRSMKRLVNQGMSGSLEDGLRFEMDHVHAYATTHPVATEGLMAFKEKRQPVFSAHRTGS